MSEKVIGERLKIRIKYDKGSQTFGSCNLDASDSQIYQVASAIANLRNDEDVEITKIVETDLVG